MNRTKIEWCDYTINPVKGICPMQCKDNSGEVYCYATKMYKRFKWNPEIHWDESCLEGLREIKKPSRIFVGSTMELFGDWVGFNAVNYILNYIRDYPQHTFIFLTKLPEAARDWKFPSNCWVGLSVTHQGIGEKNFGCDGAITSLEDTEVTIKFISFEPLLGRVHFGYYVDFVDWVIIGCETPISAKTFPKREWVDEIIEAADTAKIPVFVKEPMASYFNIKRQEMPGEKIA